MNKYDVRRNNLLRIKNELCGGKQKELAIKIGRTSSYLSRMLSEPGKTGHRRIAEDMADVITNAFNLPQGWLDANAPIPLLKRFIATMCLSWT